MHRLGSLYLINVYLRFIELYWVIDVIQEFQAYFKVFVIKLKTYNVSDSFKAFPSFCNSIGKETVIIIIQIFYLNTSILSQYIYSILMQIFYLNTSILSQYIYSISIHLFYLNTSILP